MTPDQKRKMACEILDNSGAEFGSRIAKSLIETFGPAICPIIGIVDGNAHQWGTGTLFKIAERRFIITAAHVMKTMRDARADPLISDYGPNSPGIPLYNSSAVMFLGGWDCAVVEVQPAVAARVPNRRWITMLDFAYPPPTLNDGYYICGYPMELTERTAAGGLSQSAMGFLTEGAAHDGLADFDSKLHIALRGPSGRERTVDGVAMPSTLKGISGCSVWRVWSGQQEHSWNPACIKMVGIQTGVYDPSGTIKATIWGAALQLLWKQFEELRPSMRLHLPKESINLLEQRFG